MSSLFFIIIISANSRGADADERKGSQRPIMTGYTSSRFKPTRPSGEDLTIICKCIDQKWSKEKKEVKLFFLNLINRKNIWSNRCFIENR